MCMQRCHSWRTLAVCCDSQTRRSFSSRRRKFSKNLPPGTTLSHMLLCGNDQCVCCVRGLHRQLCILTRSAFVGGDDLFISRSTHRCGGRGLNGFCGAAVIFRCFLVLCIPRLLCAHLHKVEGLNTALTTTKQGITVGITTIFLVARQLLPVQERVRTA